jgi:uncharacterized protein YndB with AHSA1/START domain
MSTTFASPQPQASAVPFVKHTRVIRANRQAVYYAWTQPEIIMKWWGPADAVCTAAELDVRKGGAASLTIETLPHFVRPPGMPRSFTVRGVYTEVVPNERLQFTLGGAPWSKSVDSLVTVTFRDADGGTELTLLHERISADMVQAYDAGWSSTIGKLVALWEA